MSILTFDRTILFKNNTWVTQQSLLMQVIEQQKSCKKCLITIKKLLKVIKRKLTELFKLISTNKINSYKNYAQQLNLDR